MSHHAKESNHPQRTCSVRRTFELGKTLGTPTVKGQGEKEKHQGKKRTTEKKEKPGGFI